MAAHAAIEELDRIADSFPVDLNNPEPLIRTAMTTLSSKMQVFWKSGEMMKALIHSQSNFDVNAAEFDVLTFAERCGVLLHNWQTAKCCFSAFDQNAQTNSSFWGRFFRQSLSQM